MTDKGRSLLDSVKLKSVWQMWDHSNAAALPNNVVKVVVMWRVVEGNG